MYFFILTALFRVHIIFLYLKLFVIFSFRQKRAPLLRALYYYPHLQRRLAAKLNNSPFISSTAYRPYTTWCLLHVRKSLTDKLKRGWTSKWDNWKVKKRKKTLKKSGNAKKNFLRIKTRFLRWFCQLWEYFLPSLPCLFTWALDQSPSLKAKGEN